MRYIDADKLLEDLNHEGFMAFITLANSGTEDDLVYDRVIEYCGHLVEKIKEQPTSDVMPKIRCEMCKHYIKESNYCPIWNDEFDCDFFCGKAEVYAK